MRFPVLFLIALVAVAQQLPVTVSRRGEVQPLQIPLPSGAGQYSLLYSLDSLSGLRPDARVAVTVKEGGTILASKILHAGDGDVYLQFRLTGKAAGEVEVKPKLATGRYWLQVNRWPSTARVKSLPAHRWQDAQPLRLGETVYGYGDDAEYVPLPGTPRGAVASEAERTDWYRFDFSTAAEKLVFFQIELMERDQVPVNVALYRLVDGKLVEYSDAGGDPVSQPHEVQALPGNKFTPRLLREAGTYYIAVRANHPEYKLVTRVYDPPPYRDARQAVRTGLDYILAAGDSWHANTPRRGGILSRIESPHQETTLCVACHATHFTQRAQLYAARNGYPVVERAELAFLAERFYNNPRPFYGFEKQGAVWSRMISAPANVLGRMGHLMDLYERAITGERRPGFHEGIAQYLKLYYDGRDKLPPDETNGNTPLVSAHEVAWYAWTETRDPNLPGLVAKGEVKNVADLCYQTLALADMDREKYRAQIAANVERLLGLQREDGQWSYRLEVSQPSVEFQTGHVLWTLHEAGVPVTEPQVAKAIAFLLGRQQAFGGWLDPLQSFENFRTPFRETQFAILGLSGYFPASGEPAKGWNTTPPARLNMADPVALLDQLDQVWDRPQADIVARIREIAGTSNDVLLRQAAVEALGRLGDSDAVLFRLLGDPSKLVQRTAAWAVRQAYSRHPKLDSGGLVRALQSDDDRMRWGAARVFAQHFAALAARQEFVEPLAHLSSDRTVAVEIMAIKGLWQFWFWTPETDVKSRIEDVLLARMGKPADRWTESNLHDAIYNLADENIRYLYNNWVPLLARGEDRETAIRGRLAIEARLAEKFVVQLESSAANEKKLLLRFLTAFPLRRADVYDLDADLDRPAAPVYNRIGNDIEQIVFFGASAERMARALNRLMDSQDAELRHLAAEAVLLVRPTNFGAVNRVAGSTGPEVRLAMLKVQNAGEAEAEVWKALKPPAPPSGGGKVSAAVDKPTVRLDQAFFRGYVLPILERKGKDGYACVQCHDSHAIFRGNYETALKVVDPAHPEDSLLLRKPTASSETEGLAGTLAHGGGVRFGKDSPEYTTILDWIKGAKE